MNSFTLAFLAVALCFGASSALPSLSTLWYDFSSTFRVINYLCCKGSDSITQQLATDFFNCYDAAPAGAKAIYTQCQVEQGAVMNTTAGIQKTCKNLITFPAYVTCLATRFKAAGINTIDAVTAVNKCEEQVLGIGSKSG